jgi:hypothetical protein
MGGYMKEWRNLDGQTSESVRNSKRVDIHEFGNLDMYPCVKTCHGRALVQSWTWKPVEGYLYG